MKSMRITKAALMVVILFSANLFAKSNPAEKRCVDQIQSALTSENQGVVESAIFVSLSLKNYFPEVNFGKVVNKLNDLVADGGTPVIKYKAQLASLYFSYPALFSDIKINTKENPDTYFKMISERLVNNSLASN
jgi:hypothetical protein